MILINAFFSLIYTFQTIPTIQHAKKRMFEFMQFYIILETSSIFILKRKTIFSWKIAI